MWRSETDGARDNFSIVRKGYDREAVDRSLADLRNQLQQATEKVAKLEAELAQSKQLYETLRADTRLALSDPERASKLLGQEASEVLKSANDAALGLRRKAESTAKDLVERARREADEIARQAKLAAEAELEEARSSARAHLEEVRQQGQEILAMADSTASSTVEAAKREGRSLVFRAREHAANLTQQAENRAAMVREEVSGLDLERQHLIGLLRTAQDLVRSSLSSLDTRPLTSEQPRTSPDGDQPSVGNQPLSTSESNREDFEGLDPDVQSLGGEASVSDHVIRAETSSAPEPTQQPTTNGDLHSDTTDAPQIPGKQLPSEQLPSEQPETGDREITLQDVARLIELAAEQTAALDLDEPDVFEDSVDPAATSDHASPVPVEDAATASAGSPNEAEPAESNGNESDEVFDHSLNNDPSDNQIADDAVDDSRVREANNAMDTDPQQPMTVLENGEFEDEIVVVERYRQSSQQEEPAQEDAKTRLQRLEALFSELREEAPEFQNIADLGVLEDPTPNDSTSTTSEEPESKLVPEPASGAEPALEVGAATEPDFTSDSDQLATKIHTALRELLDPRTVDLSRRVKRITQDGLNQILSTIRSGGREGAMALIERMLADGDARSLDVRLLVARVVHAGSDFGALLGDRTYDPSGPHFDGIVDDVARDLTTALAEVTLSKAFEAIDSQQDGGEAELVARTNGAYREARRKLDELINDIAIGAFCRGVRLVPGATGYLWITSSTTQPCADCEDNMLAGINPVTEAFPTGHENPPAHHACTCVIVPVFA